VRAVAVESTLHALTQPDHRHLVYATLEGGSREAVLDQSSMRAAFDGGVTPALDTARRFALLGMQHIITGYDHLAFLFVLLVGASSLLDVVRIVTAFTVAHSVTLGLATFGLVALPASLIESLIALSIAWVAVENLLLDHLERRWRVAFLFGPGEADLLQLGQPRVPRPGDAAGGRGRVRGRRHERAVAIRFRRPAPAGLQRRRVVAERECRRTSRDRTREPRRGAPHRRGRGPGQGDAGHAGAGPSRPWAGHSRAAAGALGALWDHHRHR